MLSAASSCMPLHGGQTKALHCMFVPEQHDSPAAQARGTAAGDTPPSASSGGVLGLGSSAVAAIGSKFGVKLNRTPAASGSTTPRDAGEHTGLRGRASGPSDAGLSADQVGCSSCQPLHALSQSACRLSSCSGVVLFYQCL